MLLWVCSSSTEDKKKNIQGGQTNCKHSGNEFLKTYFHLKKMYILAKKINLFQKTLYCSKILIFTTMYLLNSLHKIYKREAIVM